ncbi:MAG: hypothetical protein HYY60_00425 [Parcubacteria group bacterium]|nr:hypothetical protein [Parcubacteria group bacterium]MBI3074880.1 hypothetical protein [Parcubacteria group bacterium]
MLLQTWGFVLTQSFQELWVGIVSFVPNILVALIIFIVGWIVGVLLGRVVAHAIDALKLDSALKSANVDELLARAGFRLDSGRFIGALVKWFVIVVFLVATLDVLKLTQVNAFLQNVVLAYLPQVIAAALILLIAAVLAQALRKVVIGAAKAAGIDAAGLLGGLTKWAVWIFGILIALSQLGIADFFARTLFTGVVVALAIALGLAFGLGGQEAAARFLEEMRKDMHH